jgi:hypothetical protein
MNNEKPANRTAESFGQKIEREALEAQEPASDPSEIAEASNASKAGRIEIPIPEQFTPTAVPGLYPKQDGEPASSRAAVTTKTVYTVPAPCGAYVEVSAGTEVSVWETEGGQAIIDKVVEQAAIELGLSAASVCKFAENPTIQAQNPTIQAQNPTIQAQLAEQGPEFNISERDSILATPAASVLSVSAFSGQPEPTHKPLNISASGVSLVEDWSDSGHFTTAQIVALTANELIDFKEKVIAAFKHLGLDTRKHFGV